ncbi:MAG: ABC transporter substrate-binding protein [Pseudomonadota bacterium]
MHDSKNHRLDRRKFCRALAGLGAGHALLTPYAALANVAPITIATLLPSRGTHHAMGTQINNGLKLFLAQNAQNFSGRPVHITALDAYDDIPAITRHVETLIARGDIDACICALNSQATAIIAKRCAEEGVLCIYCTPQTQATSCIPLTVPLAYSYWQLAHPLGVAMGLHGKAVIVGWSNDAGLESSNGFRQGFTSAGGTIAKEILVPTAQTDFQAILTEIASHKPGVVFAAMAGESAQNFARALHNANLDILLVAPGFFTQNVDLLQSASMQGVETSYIYADNITNPTNLAFRDAYRQFTNSDATAFSVIGYDAGQFVKSLWPTGATNAARALAIRDLTLLSPRGPLRFGINYRLQQNIYLRVVQRSKNNAKALISAENSHSFCE